MEIYELKELSIAFVNFSFGFFLLLAGIALLTFVFMVFSEYIKQKRG